MRERLSDLESDRVQEQSVQNYSVSRYNGSKRNVCRFRLLILRKTISRRAIGLLDEIVVLCNHENLIVLLETQFRGTLSIYSCIN